MYILSVISPDLLEILACPACDARPKVKLESAVDGTERLACSECGRRYPVRDGIPVMLVEDAEMAPGAAAGKTGPRTGPG